MIFIRKLKKNSDRKKSGEIGGPFILELGRNIASWDIGTVLGVSSVWGIDHGHLLARNMNTIPCLEGIGSPRGTQRAWVAPCIFGMEVVVFLGLYHRGWNCLFGSWRCINKNKDERSVAIAYWRWCCEEGVVHECLIFSSLQVADYFVIENNLFAKPYAYKRKAAETLCLSFCRR